MSKVYQEFLQAQEETRQRSSDLNSCINTNRAERTELLQMFEVAAISGKSTEEIRTKLKKLDEDFEFLNLEALALTKCEETGPVVDLAHKVVSSNRKSLDRLRNEWDKAMAKIKAGQHDYLKLVAEAKAVHDKGLNLSREIAAVRELVPNVPWVAGIGEEINLSQYKGPIFFDADDIAKTFKGVM